MTNESKQALIQKITELGYEVQSISDQGVIQAGGTVQPMIVQNTDGSISQIEQTTLVIVKKISFVKAL